MNLKKVEIERELNCKSPAIIWSVISTPEGMARWLADSITTDGDVMTFTWGNPWDHNEQRKARFTKKRKNDMVRFEWSDIGPGDNYVEIRMERSSITGDYILAITDFAEDDDVTWLRNIWEHNFQRLRQSSGL